MTDYAHILAGWTQADLTACGGHTPGHTPYDVALLKIWEDGTVTLSTRTYYGGGDGTPMDEWHHRTMTFSLRGNTDSDWLAEGLAEGGTAAALIDRIVAGHQTKWNGNNKVGVLDEDATEASQELADLLADAPTSGWAAWDAAEWLYGDTLTAASLLDAVEIELDASEEAIEAAAAALLAQARADQVVLVGDPADAIRRAISTVRDDAADDASEAA